MLVSSFFEFTVELLKKILYTGKLSRRKKRRWGEQKTWAQHDPVFHAWHFFIQYKLYIYFFVGVIGGGFSPQESYFLKTSLKM